MGKYIYMLPNLKIRSGTVGYNNKIFVSDEKFSLGKNEKVNAPTMKSTQTATNSNEVQAHAPTHNEGKIALVLFVANGFAIWNMLL